MPLKSDRLTIPSLQLLYINVKLVDFYRISLKPRRTRFFCAKCNFVIFVICHSPYTLIYIYIYTSIAIVIIYIIAFPVEHFV